MKLGNKTYTVKSKVGVYNCAMGLLGTLEVDVKEGGAYEYVDKALLKPHTLELAKEWLQWLNHPEDGYQYASQWGWGHYDKLVFFVFHDNIKQQGNEDPLFDMSSFLEFISQHQKELGCKVIQTPMVDNLWHTPPGYHPGRVIILIPPYTQVYEEGVKLTEEHKSGLEHVLSYPKGLTKKDKETIKKLVA